MEDFTIYFTIGWKHILSAGALDHILFLVALSALFSFFEWKKILILVTAFTIGHSITLVLSVYDFIRFNSSWVEFLIPVTIALTALVNLFTADKRQQSMIPGYLMALVFGLIHGMGFANTIRFMLAKSQSIGWPLFSFNIGIEAAQIVLVTIILGLQFLIVKKAGLPVRIWVWMVSLLALIISIQMIISRIPE